jgi:signal transduction histidine kinase
MSDSIESHTVRPVAIVQQWLTLRPADTATYITLVVGYLVSVLDVSSLTLFNFTATTIINLVCGFLLWWLSARGAVRKWQRVLALAVLCILPFLNGLLAETGLWFNFLLYFVIVSSTFTHLSFRKACLVDILLYLEVGITFAVFDGWDDLSMDWLSMLAGFAFVGAFSLSNRLLNTERKRSSELLYQLEKSNHELEEAHAQLQQYAKEIEELAITRERTRMAREIHDTLGHYLTIITIQLETISKLQRSDPARAHAEIEEARRVAAQCMQEVRTAVAALRPMGIANLDLKQALTQLGSEFRTAVPDTELTLDLETTLPAHSAELQLALYRAAQEALTNVRKHASAANVLLRLRYENENLELMVRDNGQRTPTADQSPQQSGGFGLIGLRERIELLGGQVTYGPVEPNGYRVTVSIRMPKSQATAEETSSFVKEEVA